MTDAPTFSRYKAGDITLTPGKGRFSIPRVYQDIARSGRRKIRDGDESTADTRLYGAIVPSALKRWKSLTWQQECLDKIRSFQRLETGWDSYDAPPPNATARFWTEQMLHLLSEAQFRPDRVAPSVEGGVAIAWRRGSKNANIEFFNSGEILIATRDKMGNPVIEEFSSEGLREAMEIIRSYVNP